MTDVFSPAYRSALMSRIRGKGSLSTELAVAEILRAAGLTGWRRNIRINWRLSSLPASLRSRQIGGRFRGYATPDFVFNAIRVVLFVDGCFWHCCPKHGTIPSSNVDYWQSKLMRNRHRDRFVDAALCDRGWTVLRVWEHELKDKDRLIRWLSRHLDPE